MTNVSFSDLKWSSGAARPTFLLIGAAKAGTSSLYNYLGQHPDVFLSPVKEPNFFLLAEGYPGFQGPDDERLFRRRSIWTLEAYEKLFLGRRHETAIGEASHWYLYHPDIPARINSLLPDVKLVVVLRHPVARAYATHAHMYLRSGETEADFEKAIALEPSRIKDGWAWGRYLDRGFYYRQLRRYYDIFPEEHIKVYLFEDLVHTPRAMIQDLYQYLGVSPDFVPDLSKRLNVSGQSQSETFRRLYKSGRELFRTIRGTKWIPRVLRNTVRRRFESQLVKKPLDRALSLELVSRFEGDILQLQELIGRDLTPWLQCDEAAPMSPSE